MGKSRLTNYVDPFNRRAYWLERSFEISGEWKRNKHHQEKYVDACTWQTHAFRSKMIESSANTNVSFRERIVWAENTQKHSLHESSFTSFQHISPFQTFTHKRLTHIWYRIHRHQRSQDGKPKTRLQSWERRCSDISR